MKILNSGMFPFLVHISNSPKEFNLSEEEKQKFDGSYKGLTLRVLNGDIYIHLKSKERHIIAHELFHATEFILDYVDIPLIKETSECYAYLLGHLIKQYYDK